MTASVPPYSTPSPEGTDQGKLLVVSGPSGVGKTTVVRELRAKRDIHFSVSVTTRPPRPSERVGIDYWFVSTSEFEELRADGKLLEWAEYSGFLYGTPSEPVLERLAAGDDVLLSIEVNGAMQVKEAFPDALMVFLIPPSLDELERRLRSRRDTDEIQLQRRLDVARWELAIAEERFDHLVYNREVREAVAQIERILDTSPS